VNLLKSEQVAQKLALSQSQVFALMREGTLPAPVKVGSATRWLEHEIDEWLTQLPRAHANPAPAGSAGNNP